MATYQIKGMRFVPVAGKTAERNPDRFGTILGEFYTEDGTQRLSFASKTVTVEEAKNADTVIDLTNGILTLPDGRRGRTASEGISVKDLQARLEALRKA